MNYLAHIAERIRREIPPGKLPDGDLDSLFLAYAVLALAKGEQISREDVHNAWVAWMTEQGKEHESLRPFSELPSDIKEEDDEFVKAMRRVAAE